MAKDSSQTAKLPCEQCGYENEPERVYCHNCGAKLDRSLLPKSEEKKQESPDKARKRVEKMTNPKAGLFLREVKTFFKSVVFAALAASLLLISREPDGVPDPKKRSESMRLVSSDMMEALESATPRALAFSEDDVNQYFKQMLKAKEGAVPGVQFSRAFVKFTPGSLHLNSETSLWGFPVYSGVIYNVQVKDGKFLATIKGGNLGRLRVDPQIMNYVADTTFGGLAKSLQRERKQMDRMGSIVVGDKRVDLVTKGSAVP